MPESARILKFRVRDNQALPRQEAVASATDLLQKLAGAAGDTPELNDASTNPDLLLALCQLMAERLDHDAEKTFGTASQLYRKIVADSRPLGSFDERSYFLGETALLSGKAARLLGRRTEVESWLNRAEAHFRNTVNPTPLLSRVTFQRLALQFESAHYEEVAELSPLLISTFRNFGMTREAYQCRYLEANALKHGGQKARAKELLEELGTSDAVEAEPFVAGMALVSLGDLHASNSCDDEASEAYRRALPVLNRAKKPIAIAYLKHAMAETFLRRGAMQEAIAAYRASVDDHAALNMATHVAYLRIELANALIQADLLREAEWQILAALPTINEQAMVPEGFAAMALLAESARRRRLDKGALADLRQYLKANR